MVGGEDAVGMRLEVGLESRGAGMIAEGSRGTELPRSMVCRVGTLAGVMTAEAILEVIRHAGVVPCRVGQTLKNIDVLVAFHGVACPGEVRSACVQPGSVANLRLATAPGQTSSFAALRTKPGGGGN